MAFYGMLQTAAGGAEFRLFSPESVADQAIHVTTQAGAIASPFGCGFSDRAALLAALVPLAFAAPGCWNDYKPTA